MTVNSAGGSKLYIGSTDTLTLQAEYEAESYSEIGEIENAGELGDQSAAITFTALADSRVRKFKGPRDAGTMTVVVGDDPSDAGQAALIAAEAQPFNYNFKLELNDPLTL